ncbi:MAG: calcium-binding protein [Pseudomonadota bacterium]
MPTNYTETFSRPDDFGQPAVDELNGGVPVPIEVGDTITGNVGQDFGTNRDNTDRYELSVTPGKTYVFDVTSSTTGDSLNLTVGDQQITKSALDPLGSFTERLTVTADATGLIEISAFSFRPTGWTFELVEIIDPTPTGVPGIDFQETEDTGIDGAAGIDVNAIARGVTDDTRAVPRDTNAENDLFSIIANPGQTYQLRIRIEEIAETFFSLDLFSNSLSTDNAAALTVSDGGETLQFDGEPSVVGSFVIKSDADGDYIEWTPTVGGSFFFQMTYFGDDAGGAAPDAINYALALSDTGTPAVPSIFAGPTSGDDNLTGNMTADTIDLLGGNDTFLALGGSDKVTAGAGDDLVEGECGNDHITGDEGDDTLHGGNGRDTLLGGADMDLLEGGNNEDLLDGGSENDTLKGDAGDDTMLGGDGDDDLDGGLGDDSLTLGAGSDIVRLMKFRGNDTVTDFTVGEDLLDVSHFKVWDIDQLSIQANDDGVRINFGNFQYVQLDGLALGDLTNADFILDDAPEMVTSEGSDNLIGTSDGDLFELGAGSDTVDSRGGADTIDGGSGRDWIDGGFGDDLISGGTGADVIWGDGGNDTIDGGSSNDRLFGQGGDDLIRGGSNNDQLFGQGGEDSLFGENGNDLLDGGARDDSLHGGGGKDTLIGGLGDDTLQGGTNDDLLTGGEGADVFDFDWSLRRDTVTDFEDGVDLLDVSDLGMTDISQINFVQVGDDVVGDFAGLFGGKSSITLLDTDLADLSNADLILDVPFVPPVVGTDLAD